MIDAHSSALRSIARVVEETAQPTPGERAVVEIAAMLRRAPALALTGVGVSTDSGIPDYRGPRGSLCRHRPVTFQEFLYDAGASHRYWARSYVGWRVMYRASLTRYITRWPSWSGPGWSGRWSPRTWTGCTGREDPGRWWSCTADWTG